MLRQWYEDGLRIYCSLCFRTLPNARKRSVSRGDVTAQIEPSVSLVSTTGMGCAGIFSHQGEQPIAVVFTGGSGDENDSALCLHESLAAGDE